MGINTITPHRLYETIQISNEVELIDVRTPAEYREVHISFARNVPLDRLDPTQLIACCNGSTQPLYVVCYSGTRAGQACEKLVRAGLANVVSVEGGTKAWDAAGLPVVRGKAMISLQRQVQIAAGLLVLVGTVLGYFVHPYFLGIPAFVGAGVMTAGLTGSCAMGLMLAKMPWNQVADDTESNAVVQPVESCCQPPSVVSCGETRRAS